MQTKLGKFSGETTIDAIYTIGHSTRSMKQFLDLLKDNGVRVVVDVRRFASSKKFPHFNKENLEKVLGELDIEYYWFEALGGFRGGRKSHYPGKCLKKGGLEAYKKHMGTREFKEAFAKMLRMSESSQLAIMCSEREWKKCHRSILSAELEKYGKRLIHLS